MLTKEENAVYALIANTDGKITQLQIARSIQCLGCHPEHEGYTNHKASTLRKVRQVIRDLRINHGIPILSRYGFHLLYLYLAYTPVRWDLHPLDSGSSTSFWLSSIGIMAFNFSISSMYLNPIAPSFFFNLS